MNIFIELDNEFIFCLFRQEYTKLHSELNVGLKATSTDNIILNTENILVINENMFFFYSKCFLIKTQHSHNTGKQISVENFNDIFDKMRFITALLLIALFTPKYISFVFRNGLLLSMWVI